MTNKKVVKQGTDLILEIAMFDLKGATDEERAAFVKKINTNLKAIIKTASTKQETMEDIVDKHAAKVDTSGVDIPSGIKMDIASDLETLNKIAEADKASQDAAFTAVTSVGRVLFTFLPLLLA